ncbi:universal stress protein A [Marinicauda pacifica]|jgi:nucleotide-binding universal stress UspA family protein|uniref:Universal stress protein n=1 Tax=Marinicauda pacifica TaxID=1133559 RepID=A0A4S2H9H0_9PROT|nr:MULTISPECIES: universal stress protein [Marinicauda]TGY92510.1 universal stress protein [Marinicauda pacifica]GGE49515.1 universal stress protein A [Marinicauda pacifica]
MDDIRKFLVIADTSEESANAAYFAARRAKHSGGRVTLLTVVEPTNFEHWLGVGETMRREATDAAEAALESLAEDVEAETGTRPEMLLREGELLVMLRDVIEADRQIAVLILSSSKIDDTPGPLISTMARGRGLFTGRKIPVTVVPGTLSREEIDRLA